MKNRSVFVILVTAAMKINAAIIFEDDFTSGANSNLKWSTSLNEYITHSFVNGACQVVNSHASAYGCLPQKSISNRPQTFTVKCKMTFTGNSSQGGLGVCFNPTDYTCHYVSIKSDGTVMIFKKDSSAVPLPCSFLTNQTNELKISKKGNDFNVFINGHFFTNFSDSRLASGDVALIVNQKSTILFDDVVITDVFESGSKPTEFEDDFSNSSLVGWNKQINKGTAVVNENKLVLTTENVNDAYIYLNPEIDPSDAFSLSMEVTHVSGSEYDVYGFTLHGDDPNTNRAIFGVCAKRLFLCSIAQGQMVMQDGSSSIKGKAYTEPGTGAVTYYTDTIKVVKTKENNNCYFIVNKDTLDTLENVSFSIKSVNVFCSDSLQIKIDNFKVDDLNPVNVVYNRNSKNRHVYKLTTTPMAFDVLGRAVYKRIGIGGYQKVLGQGMYIIDGRKKIMSTIGNK